MPERAIRLIAQHRAQLFGSGLTMKTFDDLWPHEQSLRRILCSANEQDATIIRHPAVIVPSRKDADQPAIVHDLVTLAWVLELVRPNDQCQVLRLAEALGNVSTKHLHDVCVLRAVALVGTEGKLWHGSVDVRMLHGVRPQDVVDNTVQLVDQIVRGQGALHRTKHVQRPIAIAKAAVQNEDAAIHTCNERQPSEDMVEIVEEYPARSCAKRILASLVEAFPALGGCLEILVAVLMVPPVEPHQVRIDNLECEEKRHYLELMSTPVDPVPIENVGDRDIICTLLLPWSPIKMEK
mmetsp:Transcript_1075/g.4465  ORF Transcript_1075/g.4465 Transcript_1075/m.4465 type:complete len:294 (-) Transcript_1075:968-1849(-)